MPRFKHFALAGFISLAPLGAVWADATSAEQLSAARQEGSIWTAFALNRQLSPFKLSVKVVQGTATLEGKVESEVDRELAERLALNIQGVDKVDNRLLLDAGLAEQSLARQGFAQRIDDATLTATIKSKLLWNASTHGMATEVTTQDGVVTLKGQAQTADAKQLAGTLASNTDGVYEVNNLISLGAADTATTRAETAAKQTEEAISDGWITNKVKASFILSRNLDGLSIDVTTKDGIVSLTGTVVSTEEKSLAVEMARSIRGVRGIDADRLRVTRKATG